MVRPRRDVGEPVVGFEAGTERLNVLCLGDGPVRWLSSFVQAVGIALCLGEAIGAAPLPLWTNLIGFGCVIGSLFLGTWGDRDTLYFGPLAIAVLPLSTALIAAAFLFMWADCGEVHPNKEGDVNHQL